MARGGGTAFPGTDSQPNERGVYYPVHHQGMSLRDWFAGQALEGHGYDGWGAQDIAEMAYEIADAMLAARTAGEGEKQ